jgi:hypothetical protein
MKILSAVVELFLSVPTDGRRLSQIFYFYKNKMYYRLSIISFVFVNTDRLVRCIRYGLLGINRNGGHDQYR